MGHLSFRQRRRTGKTAIVAVGSKYSGEDLGQIRWWAPWHRYVFFPNRNSLYDSACLKEVSESIDAMMLHRKAAGTNTKG